MERTAWGEGDRSPGAASRNHCGLPVASTAEVLEAVGVRRGLLGRGHSSTAEAAGQVARGVGERAEKREEELRV